MQCENSNTCCVSSCKDHFFIEMVMIPMQLEISVSNTLSVEVHHTVLVFKVKFDILPALLKVRMQVAEA